MEIHKRKEQTYYRTLYNRHTAQPKGGKKKGKARAIIDLGQTLYRGYAQTGNSLCAIGYEFSDGCVC